MASQGPTICGTGADDGSNAGMSAWSNPGNITAEDGTFATCSLGLCIKSHLLVATNFGFSIPGGATIDGITVEWKRKAASSSSSMNEVSLFVIGPSGSGNKASATGWTTSLAWFSYGGASDLWGTSPTPSDINSAGFGSQLAVQGISSDTADVDACRITVNYTPAATGGVPRSVSSVRTVHPSHLE